ncbi:unnamed protein product [Caenorhabditis bovis]|uniref:Uncharacterized protein n=1 Tax=Caenorhabditis bovis TaxID=2654633 RepID=A0A8S1ET23_9PELO|nr:unnamed protein product [Caenorhabditis bovis]
MTPVNNSSKKEKSGPIEYSPAAELIRKHPYSSKKPRKGAPKMEEDKFLSPIAPASCSSTKSDHFELPKIDSLRFKPIKTLSSRIDGTEYIEEASTELIQEMLEMGRIDEAMQYADTLYANFVSENKVDIVALADYIKILTVLRQWRRINHLIARNNYHQIHIVFAYYAVTALFHRKLYEDIIDIPVGHLIPHMLDYNLPIRSPSHVTGKSVEDERTNYSFANMAELDSIARKMGLAPALTLVFAESFLKLMNRDSAMLCIAYSVKHIKSPVLVERLMTKYNLVEPSEWEKYKKVRKAQLALQESSFDPNVLIERAQFAYEMGRFAEAKKLTDLVFDNYGPHPNCMLLRIHCMVILKDTRGLLDLGHQLVADDPHIALPWYCVALYYYTIGANARARSYISKCTVMDSTFADAWVAFGHILHYEVEHEQSMSCYYRASKLVDRSSEPFLYVALQYSTHSQKLSKKFMAEAVARSPKDPMIRHEQACIAYAAKNFEEAEEIFMEVLYMVTEAPEDMDVKDVLKKRIEDFWRPMVNNLGHISRRRGKLEDAIMFHKRALKMEPKFVDAIASIGICNAILGNINTATEFFNRALAIDPFNETIRQCMSRMVLTEQSIHDIDDFKFTDYLESPQEVIPNSSLRKPHNDSWMISSLPKCTTPMASMIKQSLEKR